MTLARLKSGSAEGEFQGQAVNLRLPKKTSQWVAFFWKSYSDNDIVGGMVFVSKRNGKTLPQIGSRRDAGGTRTTTIREGRRKHAVLPNEPTVFRHDFVRNWLYAIMLQIKYMENIGGFVFENEPTGEEFMGVIRAF
jgi:hypothetical protein